VSPRSLIVVCAFVLQGAACIVTADESLWQKRVDGRTDRAADVRAGDRPGDRPGAQEPRAADRASGELRVDQRGGDRVVFDQPAKPDQGCGQVLKIAAPGDDGEIDGGPEWLPYGEAGGPGYPPAIYIGAWDSTWTWGWFRFTVVKAVPKGTTLKSVTLTLPGKATAWDPATQALEIWVESDVDADQVISYTEAPFTPGTGRPVVLKSTRWPATGGLTWSTSGPNTSPDLSAPFQQLVNNLGLAAGSHVQLWLRAAQLADGEVGTPDSSEVGYSQSPALLTICQ
jgi:hypothetical protein